MSTELTENTEKSDFLRVFREFRGHSFSSSCSFVLLSGHFLFFMYTFHATISITYWFAIDIAIRYRYRSCPAFSIASSDIDSDPERITTPVAPWLR
ncbi:MAG: hypothetical protein BECKG1743D_GA0114223_101393 [Candidatus Kentron sp. G]|nr:MAG: hypothetical protein BECKG1743F_GA0114225_100962 [Candidatus Kentron sp. G]VFM98554.1 MAG: hypothetical protein BECKG1743E_GA0114224_101963 [Candidatus Kentron sp. G]VFM99686.1 MAG: hypothetical protein BECKG1743D_GA0114223_101393 [Candidatus Kentron sp. G]